MSDLISDGFDVTVTHAKPINNTKFLGVTLDYINTLINRGYVVKEIQPARCPISVVAADCARHPNSVTNG